MLAEFDPRIERTTETIEVFAPDGDVVLQALNIGKPRWVVRLHPEVFDAEEH